MNTAIQLNTVHRVDLIRTLQDIHALLVDGRIGYREAVERVGHFRVKNLLSVLSAERSTMEGLLASDLRKLDPAAIRERPVEKAPPVRSWKDARDPYGNTTLAECERGETYLLVRYDEVLSRLDLPTGMHSLLFMQRAQIQGNLSRILELRSELEGVVR